VKTKRFRRGLAAGVVSCALVFVTAVPSQAYVLNGSTSVSKSSTSYQFFKQICHWETYPMSFWNNASAYETRVKNTNGPKTYTADLTSGEWIGWTSAQVPPGEWYFYAKRTSPSGSGYYSLSYSIVYRPCI